MRIAAIDLGSNSFHMVIVESRSGSFHVLDREKEMIRLGERSRKRSVIALAERSGYDEPHARQVARLALEQWAAARRGALLERALEHPLRLDFAPVAVEAPAAPRAARA
jgi:exopolyphosphatase/pppGpp-phosphohydrolase